MVVAECTKEEVTCGQPLRLKYITWYNMMCVIKHQS